MKKNQISIIGLGKIGSALAKNFCSNNFFVYGFDIKKHAYEFGKNFYKSSSIEALIKNTTSPRLIFVVVPSGKSNSSVINWLLPIIHKTDTVIDMSNSNYKFAEKFEKKYFLQGKSYIDIGISGGIVGAHKGPSLMVGNKKNVSKKLINVLSKISAKYKNRPCVEYYENPGSGHFVKMLHNYLEYAEMQLIAELVSLLYEVYELNNEKILSFLKELRLTDKSSYLLKITESIIHEKILQKENYIQQNLIKHNGTAKWAAQLSLEIESYAPTLICALLERLSLSQKKDSLFNQERKKIIKIKFSASKKIKLINSYTACRSSIFLQLINTIEKINADLNYNLDISKLANNWINGSIVKSNFLNSLAMNKRSFVENNIVSQQKNYNTSFCELLTDSTHKSIAIPVMYSAWQFLQNYESNKIVREIIGKQRFVFGGHKLSELKSL